MKAVFPGKPQAKLHALSTALWEGQRFLVYISNNVLIILNSPSYILQTISHAESDFFEAVALCDTSGKIATCTTNTVFVYRPVGQETGLPSWSLQHTLTPACNDTSLACLCWGLPEELLASGSHATLFHTGSEPREMWSRDLANPAKFSLFTPDASFIASTGWQDRLVKIWERLFLDDDEERFDISYLSHPAAVTSLRWHRRPHQDHHSDTVLYTMAADSKLRIWAATDHHALQPLQLWTEFDLTDCVLPRSPISPSSTPRRYMFILDGWEFESLVEQAIYHSIGGEREKHTREHLLDVAYRNPDICVVIDDQGNMSAWGLERVGCKARQPNDVFNILFAEQVDFHCPDSTIPDEDYVCLYNFAGVNDGNLNLVANHFDGTIHWLSSPVDHFFDTSSSAKRFDVDAILTGAAEPIHSIVSSVFHSTLLSLGSQHELLVWSQNDQNARAPLHRSGVCETSDPILLACLVENDEYLVTVHETIVVLWNIQNRVPCKVVSCKLQLQSAPICLVTLPLQDSNGEEFLALITEDIKGLVLRITTGKSSPDSKIEVFASLQDGSYDTSDIKLVSATKRHRNARGSKSDICAVSSSGMLTLWSFQLSIANKSCLLKCHTMTATYMADPSIVQAEAHGKVAIVSSKMDRLAIWDTTLDHLEHMEEFRVHESVEALDFTCTDDCHTLLAVASLHKARIYSQDRYNYSNGNSPWVLLRSVEIGQQTNLPILDCAWLTNLDLLLAAGNQMFLFGGNADVPDSVISSVDLPADVVPNESINKISNALNAVPAIFAPELNGQMLASGNLDMIDLLLARLRNALKFWSPGDELDSSLGISVEQRLESDAMFDDEETSHTSNSVEDRSLKRLFSADSAAALNETLDGIDIPYISDAQQIHLANLADSFGFFEKQRDATDSLGMRYLITLHQHVEAPLAGRLQLPWRDIVWAFHSENQDILIDMTSKMYGGRMTWKDARDCGMFMWIQDTEVVRTQFEVIARNEYTKTDERNPLDCSLHYLALKKKTVLQGLWRLATWNKERGPTMRLLNNDFNEPRWRTAALKNAYALLGLRRFEYAAAFFLLANHLKDAVSVLANQVKDIQLAIAVARVYEGDSSSVLKDLLRDKVLPKAAQAGNRWLATWAYWMLHDKQMALCALTEPLEKLVKLSETPPIESKHFRNNEPSLAVFFSHLRDKIQRNSRGAVSLAAKAEWDLVKRSAISYVRAGCHVLALDLVRNWRFSDQTAPRKLIESPKTPTGPEVADTKPDVEQLKNQVRAVNSTNSIPNNGADANKMNGSLLPERKKIYEEPSAASILDNFDF